VQADFVEAGGTRLFVRHWGDSEAPAILYWHGGGGGSGEWPEIAPALVDAGFAVYAPDAPGYGDSPLVEPEGYGAAAMADLAAALIDALAVAPVIWVGYSWGASVGVRTAVSAQGRVRGLTLLDGAYLIPDDVPDYDPTLDLEGRIEELQKEIEEDDSWDAPVEVMARAMEGSDTAPLLPLLREVAESGLPVLLVEAMKPPEYAEIRARALARFQAALPPAEVRRVDSGHGVFSEAGDDVRAIVLDWLGRLD
jgi:pimeloyl-ACP methyl ester carboxylesterase